MHTSVVSAYIIGVGVFIVMLVIAAIISSAIKFQPGSDPKDPIKRKVTFWICAVFALVLTFATTYIFEYQNIKLKSKQEDYLLAMAISSVLALILYIGIGFVISKASGHGKLSNWFRNK